MYQVAIIIPTLNEEKFIGKCLDSVLAQTFAAERMDIMVVDGGSRDRTKEIVSEYSKMHNNIRFITNPQKIQSAAFNIGVKESTAPYIIRLDAHALYDVNYVELCVNGLQKDQSCGNVGGLLHIKPQSNSIVAEANAILNKLKFGIGGASFRVGAKAGYVDTVPFGAFPRTVIDAIGGMREDLPRGEDNEFNSRIRKHGFKIYFNPDIICTYFARDSIKSSIKQMYANGFSIGRLLQIDRKSVGLRHIVPFAFVLSCIVFLTGGFLWHLLWYILLCEIAAYVIADILADVSACIEYGFKYLPILFILFPLIHISYGWGTLVGIIKKYT